MAPLLSMDMRQTQSATGKEGVVVGPYERNRILVVAERAASLVPENAFRGLLKASLRTPG
ncbi:hypothetical protein SARC_11167 [Sphaeroforma arctica JP610]|uniref:Uncharacterized protein n=1 Tax=Sphaeroforma arctica JP610 TaxID=667725 RepID=A0A0L0FIL8_9EUKA|nr:hypothetical protein SARC_11167 [Sphaeroforma arctica JP610]KNC76326.1 hypothetical protein SARC_11167 [Sphaeroforma arctica JP610]|eukprot:XP_014150228.1 hypothetical protein SARC_11167 [Sphaeroforma arctica JP610]